MANIQSQVKRNRQNEKRRIKNARVKSSVRSAYKMVVKAVEANDKAGAENALDSYIKIIDTATGKKIYHRNTAARKKSRLSARVNGMKDLTA